MGIDEIGVDKMGVDEVGSRRSGMILFFFCSKEMH